MLQTPTANLPSRSLLANEAVFHVAFQILLLHPQCPIELVRLEIPTGDQLPHLPLGKLEAVTHVFHREESYHIFPPISQAPDLHPS